MAQSKSQSKSKSKSSSKQPAKAQPKTSSAKLWLVGARLRTLPLAIAPVLLGTAAASIFKHANYLLASLALAVALLLQIGVNYANDYSDGIRGTDDNRVGPMRLTASGQVRAKNVKLAAFICFGLAMVAGLAIVVLTQLWWLLLVGAVCVVAAWYYTGGKHPYGYAGLGEVAVFIFFGLVATLGTAYIQEQQFNFIAVYLALSAGFFATAVLMVNNIRDIETDKISKKRTLAVKLGAKKSKALFFLFLWLPMVLHFSLVLIFLNTVMAYLALFLVAPITVIVAMSKTSQDLILALKLTSFAALVYALFTFLGVFL